ncbi:hypothetical protein [Pseudoxanthomonas winnipegensis]|uniref:hypothetical protein n=1 Tax=Pseudoxanthomonas winnipegensis TaxID=2480810 RepID=UPI003F868C35
MTAMQALLKSKAKAKLSHGFAARATFVLSKVAKTASRRDASRRYAAVPCASRKTGHGAQTRFAQTGRLFGPVFLRCSARFTAQTGKATAKAKALEQQQQQQQQQQQRR